MTANTPAPTFYLIAAGSFARPQINIAQFEDNLDRIKADCSKIAAALSGSGYFNFWLLNLQGETMFRITVTAQDPVVSIVG